MSPAAIVTERRTIRKLLSERGVQVEARPSGLLLDGRLVYNPATYRCAARTTRERELGRVRCYLLGTTSFTRADLLARLLGK